MCWLLGTLVATAATAQTFTVQSVTAATLGTVAAASSGTTIFQIYGTTITTSGSGAYISGTQTTCTVTVNCAGTCNGATARVNVTRTGVNGGRGQTIDAIGAVAVSPATLGGTTSNSSGVLDFTMTGWTGPGTQQFQLGIRLPVLGDDASSATTASSGFTVAVANNPTTPSGGTPSTVSGTVRRALKIVKSSDLRFGTVVRPTSGSFQVYISNSDGSRGTTPNSWSGNLVTSTYGAAVFTITGEPSTTYSLSYPSTFSMTGPDTITVTLVGTVASGSQTLPASGSQLFVIGAYFPITSTQATGNYAGTFNVTLAYN